MNATITRSTGPNFTPRFSHFRLLNDEWDGLLINRVANATTARWAEEEPTLAGLVTIASFESARQRPIAEIDTILAALLRRASFAGREGDLASRIVFQFMLPKAARLTSFYRDQIPDLDERCQLALTSLWIAIKEHPRHLGKFIAPNIGWRAHKIMRKEALVLSQETPMGALGGEYEHANIGEDFGGDDLHPSEQLAMVLVWAVAQKVLTIAEAEMLSARYSSESIGEPAKQSWKTVADVDLGISPAAMRQRCSRAARRLAAAIAAYEGVAA
ncbi:hypothetical protein LO762_26195 [Actinocorallia sp. API 0066]|uniref:hypothetical protein n=1 Tax=Actinocorallia sp. API 0066 TaxID=2896846 RepID=UPI001E5CE6B4|nr:hypothetical protein [Actinocorallia sp. API 0066]MCD0452647.1 hypothetical protein [Actinocorallia sp. API 0066]